MDSIGRICRAAIFHTIQLGLFGQGAGEGRSTRGIGRLRLQGFRVVVQLQEKHRSFHLKHKENGNVYSLDVETDADLHVNSWNVEDCGLQVIGFGLQSGGTLLSSKKMSG